jgi:hypothetical protein
MASTLSGSLRLSPLRKRSMAQLIVRAKEMGVAPEEYARQLVEDGLALQREAESMSIVQIMAPVRKTAGTVDEAEIVKLVETARADHHGGTRRGKKR